MMGLGGGAWGTEQNSGGCMGVPYDWSSTKRELTSFNKKGNGDFTALER